MRPPPLPSKRRSVPPPSRRGVKVPSSQADTVRRPSTLSNVTLMQLVGELEKLDVVGKRRMLELIHGMGPLVTGSSAEFNRRFVALLAGVGPVLKSATNDSQKRLVELIGFASKLDPNDQERLIDLACRLQTGRS